MSNLVLCNMNKKSSELCTLDISGDLNLSTINFPKFSKNVTVPDELNDYLRGQLDHMKNENESLQQELSKRDLQLQSSELKIKDLLEKIKDYEGCYNNEYTSASQLANGKIVMLSKKLREKSSEIEVYKSKCSKLEDSLSALKKHYEGADQIDKENCVNEPDEIKKTQDKLAHTTNKWIEEKNQNLKLKNDLKRANKWLQQEIGDKFETLLALNNSNSNWRGRAQIICDLQQKNQELKEKLKGYQDKSTITNAEPNQIKFDKRIEVLNRENSAIKNNCEELKRKFDATKARCKVLETECGLFKSKLSSLNQQLETDQQTIARLTMQTSCQNELKNEDMKQKGQTIKKLEQENNLLKIELIKEKCLSENKSKELLEKNGDIQLLNKRIRSSRPPSSYVHKHENPDARTIGVLEVERLRLLELTEIQNTRLEDERNSNLKIQHLLRLERQKGAKLEANLARLQLEQDSCRSSYCSKVNTPKHSDSDITDKLELAEENIKALTTRLEIEIHERKSDLQEFAKILKNYDCK